MMSPSELRIVLARLDGQEGLRSGIGGQALTEKKTRQQSPQAKPRPDCEWVLEHPSAYAIF